MYYKIKDPVKEPVKARSCDVCGTSYIPRANPQRFCGSNCRLANWVLVKFEKEDTDGTSGSRKAIESPEKR